MLQMRSAVASIEVLGPFTLRSETQAPIDIPMGKPAAALVYVALEPHAVGRRELASLLWADSEEDRARHSVRQALSLLRKTCGDQCLRESHNRIQLDESIRLDLEEFNRALRDGRLGDAWTLWRGGLLQGFELPDAPAFNAWCGEQRSTWQRRLSAHLLARAHAATQVPQRVEWLERAIEVQPLDDFAHRHLVDSLLDVRDPVGAREALDRARCALSPEHPDWFDEAARRLTHVRRHSARARSRDGGQSMKFAGRTEILANLCRIGREALAGSPRVVTILGARGMGKTRLLEETVAWCEAESPEARVIRAHGVDPELQLENGVVAALVRSLLDLPGAAGISAGSDETLRRLLPSRILSHRAQLLPPPALAIADAFADLVHAVASETPLVIAIDNGECIDASSRRILSDLVQRLRPGAMLLGLYLRRTDGPQVVRAPVPEPSDTLVIVDLEPLRAEDIEEIVFSHQGIDSEAMHRGREPRSTPARMLASVTDALYWASGGVPGEVARRLNDLERFEAGPRPELEGPLFTDGSADGLARTIRQSTGYSERVAGLTPRSLAVARALARAPEPAAPSVLRGQVRISEADFAAAVRQLEAAGLVYWTAGGALRVTSPGARDAVRHSLRPSWPPSAPILVTRQILATESLPSSPTRALILTVAVLVTLATALVASGMVSVQVQRATNPPELSDPPGPNGAMPAR